MDQDKQTAHLAPFFWRKSHFNLMVAEIQVKPRQFDRRTLPMVLDRRDFSYIRLKTKPKRVSSCAYASPGPTNCLSLFAARIHTSLDSCQPSCCRVRHR